MPSVTLPRELKSRLARMIARVRWVLFIRGIFAVLAVAVVGILAVMAIDAAVVLIHPAARWGLSLAVAVMTLLTAWTALIRPLCQKLSLTRIARILETRHPELQERISSTIELCEHGDNDTSIRASKELLDLLAQEARTDITGIRTHHEFTWRSARPFFTALFLSGAILTAVLFLWPKEGWLLFRRAVEPFREFDTIEALAIRIHPGDRTFLSGMPVRFEVEAPFRRGYRAEILFSFPDKTERTERMLDTTDAKERKTATFALELPNVTRSFVYRIRYGNAFTLPYTIRVVDPPALKESRVTLRYPAYLDRPDTQLVARALMPLDVVEGTRIGITATFDRTCESALLIDRHRLPPTVGGNASNAWWRHTASLALSGKWAISLRDTDRFTNALEWAQFTVLPDRPPHVTLDRPTADRLHIPPNDRLQCEGTARDDWGIGEVHLVARAENGDEKIWPVTVSDPLGFTFSATPDLQALWNEGIKTFELFFRVADKRSADLGGKQIAESRKIKIRLDEWARLSREQIREETLRKMEKLMHQAHQKLNESANLIAQEKHTYDQPTLPPKAAEKLEKAHQAALDAEERLEQAARETEKTPFTAFANDLLDLRDRAVEEAMKKMDAIAAAEPDKRREAGDQAEQALRKAADELNQMFQKLQEENRRQEAASQLHALAKREERLADEAEAPLQKWAQNEWANRQQEAEQRMDQIRDRLQQDDAVNAIKQDLQKARETMQQAQQEQTQERDGQIWFERMTHDETRKAAQAAEIAAQTALDANEKAERFAEATAAEEAVRQAADRTEKAAEAALEAARTAQDAVQDRQTNERQEDAAARHDAAKQALEEANRELDAAKEAAAEARQRQDANRQQDQAEALDLARQAAEQAVGEAQKAVGQAEEQVGQTARQLAEREAQQVPPGAVTAEAEKAVAQAKEALDQAMAAQDAIRQMTGEPDTPDSPDSPGSPDNPDSPEGSAGEDGQTPERNPIAEALSEAAAAAQEADRLSMQAGERLEQAERAKERETRAQNREATELAMLEAKTAAILANEALRKTKESLRQMEREASRLKQDAETAARRARERADRAAQQAKNAQEKVKNAADSALLEAASKTGESAQLSQQATGQADQAIRQRDTEAAQTGGEQAEKALALAREALKAAEQMPQAEGKQREAADQARQLAERLNAMSQAMDQREVDAWAKARERLEANMLIRAERANAVGDDARSDPFMETNRDWMRLKGTLNSENYMELLKQTPAEYRPLVKQYFDELGKTPER
ncbi:MAG: hypothetical protein J6336_02450 [Kiritimatiellae bacterium]|nr:hypothetical protein [Kiritimatiellia bacterium]